MKTRIVASGLLALCLSLGLPLSVHAQDAHAGRSSSQNQQASILVNVFDGSRRLIPDGSEVLVRVIDGNQREVVSGFYKGPSIRFDGVPFYDNFADDYRVIVARKNHKDGGMLGVHIQPGTLSVVNLMLIPSKSVPDFSAAHAQEIEQRFPEFWRIISAGADGASARERYESLLREDPLAAMCLLNLLTSASQMTLPSGSTALPYYKELIWDDTMEQDRFFGWVDPRLLDDVRQGQADGLFEKVPGIGILHPGATDSWKQIQLDEANLHFTFHGNDHKVIDGVDCIKLELDIDYYKDKIAHTFGELIPNTVTGGLTDPRTVYELRFNSGQAAHFPPFAPPETVRAQRAEEPGITVTRKRRNLDSLFRRRLRHAW